MSREKDAETLEEKVRSDPTDADSMLELGDLYRSLNLRQRAINVYLVAAQRYAERDSWQRTAAIYKMILMLAPDELEVRSKLADVYTLLGLEAEARDELLVLAKAYENAGSFEQRDQVLKRIEVLLKASERRKHCSFCGRPEAKVKKLLFREEVVPTGGEAAICNDCVLSCIDALMRAGVE